MVIPVPTFIADSEDTHLKLFVAFMYRIASKYGFKHTYSIDTRDARIISQRFFVEGTPTFAPLYPNIRVGQLNNFELLFRFRFTPTTEMIDFTDDRSNLIWGYLIARENEWNGDLLDTEPIGFKKGKQGRLNRHEIKHFQYSKDKENKKDKDDAP